MTSYYREPIEVNSVKSQYRKTGKPKSEQRESL